MRGRSQDLQSRDLRVFSLHHGAPKALLVPKVALHEARDASERLISGRAGGSSDGKATSATPEETLRRQVIFFSAIFYMEGILSTKLQGHKPQTGIGRHPP